ncbi:MAG: hypothetical protein MN733_24570 [Nitrososphaera sp.]|nr:hypothetical protein [Nitrososphaera sp.]
MQNGDKTATCFPGQGYRGVVATLRLSNSKMRNEGADQIAKPRLEMVAAALSFQVSLTNQDYAAEIKNPAGA